jgi:hypothetical protein
MSRYATPADLIPQAHCVLGTMLRPFSLGHRLLLRKVKSPLLYSTEASDDDLALAVFICASRFPEVQESLVRGDWERDFKAWLKQLKPRFWQPSRFNHEDELKKFLAYFNEGNALPPLWRDDVRSGIEFTAPGECLLLCKLTGAGFDTAEVLEGYLPFMRYCFYTITELSQADSLTNPAKWRRVFWTAENEAAMRPETFQGEE